MSVTMSKHRVAKPSDMFCCEYVLFHTCKTVVEKKIIWICSCCLRTHKPHVVGCWSYTDHGDILSSILSVQLTHIEPPSLILQDIEHKHIRQHLRYGIKIC